MVEQEEEEEMTYGFRKMKMFEMSPSDDPELEERRQRALYAKRNRDMKKKEMVRLQREVSSLQAVNKQCQADLTHMYGRAQDQQRKIDDLQHCLSNTIQQVRDKDQHIQNSQRKMSLLKAHLELIADGLEENVSRRMLFNLLPQIS